MTKKTETRFNSEFQKFVCGELEITILLILDNYIEKRKYGSRVFTAETLVFKLNLVEKDIALIKNRLVYLTGEENKND